jgi:hypothetical protein
LFNRSILVKKARFCLLDPAAVKSQLKMQFFFRTLLSSFLKSHLYSIKHHLTPLLETNWERLLVTETTSSQSPAWIYRT